MTWLRLALILFIGVWIGNGAATAETASCSALIKKRDAECQVMAEKMEAACSGEKASVTGEQSAECRHLGAQLASHCNRNPCRAAPRKGKAKKAKPKKSDMKSSKSSDKKAPAKSAPQK